jgi:hypothetical protein
MGVGHGGACEVKSLAFPSYFTLPIDLRTRNLYGLLLIFCGSEFRVHFGWKFMGLSLVLVSTRNGYGFCGF